jgi:ankyrin repeat protein
MENDAKKENEMLKQRLADCEKDQLDALIAMIMQKQDEMVKSGKLMSDLNIPGLEETLSKFSSAGREYFYVKMRIDIPMTDDEIEDHFYKMDMSNEDINKGGKRRKSARKHGKRKSRKSRKSKPFRKSRKSRKSKKPKKSKKSKKSKRRSRRATRSRKAGVAPPPRRPAPDLSVNSESSSDEEGSSPGHIAAERGDIEGVRNWLDSRPGYSSLLLQQIDDIGETVLYIAAENGYANIVRMLIDDYNADIRNSVNGYDMLEWAGEGAFNDDVTNIIERRA